MYRINVCVHEDVVFEMAENTEGLVGVMRRSGNYVGAEVFEKVRSRALRNMMLKEVLKVDPDQSEINEDFAIMSIYVNKYGFPWRSN